MPFAQLVIGPPGSGKSTYCDGMHQLLSALDRKCSVVNLDPANDHTSYPAALDVRDLVSLEQIMDAEELGPNGGILYALEELEHNLEWLEEGLAELGEKYVRPFADDGVWASAGAAPAPSPTEDYILFDCPGQVELFTHHASLRNIFFRLQKLGYRLVVVNLVDSHALTQPTLYISTLLLSLRSMLQLELPHLNVLTKIDNLASYPPLALPLAFYTEARSLEHLLPALDAELQQGMPVDPMPRNDDDDDDDNNNNDNPRPAPKQTTPPSKFAALNEAIVELVEDYGLVGFETLAVEDRASMLALLRAVDRAGGYAFGGAEGANESVWQVAVREGGGGQMDVRDVEERWVGRRDEFDELERRMWEAEGQAERRRTGGPP